jgi:hypothetical protein
MPSKPINVQKGDLNPLKTATAVLATCIVQTLNESDPTFRERFLLNLGKLYGEFRSAPHGQPDLLETLSWTREFLKR